MNATTTYSPDGLTLHPDALRAALMFLGDDPERPHLHDLFIDEEGHLAATDGHTMIRLSSIDPGGQIPRARAGTRWTRTAAEAILTALPKLPRGKSREDAHARQRVTLRWSDAHEAIANGKAPNIIPVIEAAIEAKGKPGPWQVATCYLERLAKAADLLTDGNPNCGPILVNPKRGPNDALLFEIPWYEPVKIGRISWLHGKGPAPAAPSSEPLHAAEILIMPMRL